MIETIRVLDARLQEAALPLDPEYAGLVRLSLQKTVMQAGLFQRLTGYYRNCGTLRALAKFERLRGRGMSADPARHTALEHVTDLLRQKRQALARMRRHIRIRSLLEFW